MSENNTQNTDRSEQDNTNPEQTDAQPEQTTPPVQEKKRKELPQFVKKIASNWGIISHIMRIVGAIAIFAGITWLLTRHFSTTPSLITAGIIAALCFFVSFTTRSKEGYEYFASYPKGIYLFYAAIAGFVCYYVHDSVNQELLFWIALAVVLFSLNTTFSDIPLKKLAIIGIIVAALAGLGYFLEDINLPVVGWPYEKISSLNIKYDANVANIGIFASTIFSIAVIGSFIITKMFGIHRAHNKTVEKYIVFKGWVTLNGDTRNVEIDNRDWSEAAHGFCDIIIQDKQGTTELFRIRNVFLGWFQLPRIKKCLKIEHVYVTNQQK